MPDETRITDPDTGGEKGQKLARFDLIPPEFEYALAEHFGRGARKYADRNWEKGYAWGLTLAAMRRHLNDWQQGEDMDSETGSHHLIAVAWHAAVLYTFQQRGLGRDDVRVVPPVVPIKPELPSAAVVEVRPEDDFAPDSRFCGKHSRDHWICTRPEGHSGAHMAHRGVGDPYDIAPWT